MSNTLTVKKCTSINLYNYSNCRNGFGSNKRNTGKNTENSCNKESNFEEYLQRHLELLRR